MGHGSANDIDFILRREWIGNGSAPGANPQKQTEQDEINHLLHDVPSFMRDGSGSVDDLASVTSNTQLDPRLAPNSTISSIESNRSNDPNNLNSSLERTVNTTASSDSKARRSVESSLKSNSSLSKPTGFAGSMSSLAPHEAQKSLASSNGDSFDSSVYQLHSEVGSVNDNSPGDELDNSHILDQRAIADARDDDELRDDFAVNRTSIPPSILDSTKRSDSPSNQSVLSTSSQQSSYNDSGLSRIVGNRMSSNSSASKQGSYNDGGLGNLISPRQFSSKIVRARPRSESGGRSEAGGVSLRDLFSDLEAEIEFFNVEEGGGDGKGIVELEKELDGLVGEGRRVFEGKGS
jgi:hypothetical protein